MTVLEVQRHSNKRQGRRFYVTVIPPSNQRHSGMSLAGIHNERFGYQKYFSWIPDQVRNDGVGEYGMTVLWIPDQVWNDGKWDKSTFARYHQ